MKDRNVLITGGLGFIGSNLARRLVLQGANVTILDSMIPEYGGNLHNLGEIEDQVKIDFADVRESGAMQRVIPEQDFLFNLAGQTSHLDSMENPFTDLDINAKAQLSILESCRTHNPGIRIVFASTRQIYGRPQYLPVDEKHPWHPVDVNGVNKMAGEWYHIVYNDVYGIRSSVLRLTNTYGPRMRIKDARQTFLGIWIRNLLEGTPIQVYGDGMQRRDYNFVEDVVDALLIAAQETKADGKIFNLGASDPITLEETAKLMCGKVEGATFRKVPFPENRKAIDVGDFICSYQAFQNEFGWEPSTTFEDGITKTLEFYKRDFRYYV